MGFTKSELVQFFDELTGLISEENQSEANLLIRGLCLTLRKATNMKMLYCRRTCHMCRRSIFQ
jgi:hypothetical protein